MRNPRPQEEIDEDEPESNNPRSPHFFFWPSLVKSRAGFFFAKSKKKFGHLFHPTEKET
jgi:hypothetical protein